MLAAQTFMLQHKNVSADYGVRTTIEQISDSQISVTQSLGTLVVKSSQSELILDEGGSLATPSIVSFGGGTTRFLLGQSQPQIR